MRTTVFGPKAWARKPGEVNHESTGFGKENLPQLQDHQAQRRRARHLHGPAAQAAARLIGY
jgi:hypothetical protein